MTYLVNYGAQHTLRAFTHITREQWQRNIPEVIHDTIIVAMETGAYDGRCDGVDDQNQLVGVNLAQPGSELASEENLSQFGKAVLIENVVHGHNRGPPLREGEVGLIDVALAVEL